MTTNGTQETPDFIASTAGRNLQQLAWATPEPIPLDAGRLHAVGEAIPQVRSPERLANLGTLAKQAEHIQTVIVDSLAAVLAGMEPTVEQLQELEVEIASATLVAANSRLSAVGVSLLDLRIEEFVVVK